MKNLHELKTVQFFQRVLNWKDWSDFNRTASSSKYLYKIIRTIFRFTPPDGERAEAFTTAVERLGLEEKALKEKQSTLLRLSIVMLCTAVGLFGYCVYQIIIGHALSFMVSLSLTGVALCLWFRYHFWYFQIKERKLGCTIKEWFTKGIMGTKQ